ncbi:MAG TPA: hypothetical protein VIC58_10285 [Actinomycetota bacterium]
MTRNLRIAIVAGAAGAFVLGLFVGVLLGRSDDDVLVAPTPSPSASVSPSPSAAAPQAPVVTTPSPGVAPAISTEGQILREGARPVVPVGSTVPCNALIEPGALGECGEVDVAGQRVVWVIQQGATPTGTPTFRTRVFTFVPAAAGWVEWLEASDPAGEQWVDVNILETDLTGDGVMELLVGFRGIGETQMLDVDIVGYTQANLPVVMAHPDPAIRGSVVASAGAIQEYSAQYPAGEPVCCPPSYLHQTIGYEDGFFRVLASETVLVTAVPLSQL